MTDTERWWEHAVGDVVCTQLFADGTADGIGDVPGMLERPDHLAWLGVDIIWITPFYSAPMPAVLFRGGMSTSAELQADEATIVRLN